MADDGGATPTPNEPVVESQTPETPATTEPQVPDWRQGVPDKFLGETPEETLAKVTQSYTALEKAFSRDRGDDGKFKPKIEEPAAPPETPQTVSDILAKAGLDQSELQAAFEADGRLADDHYSALQKIGYPRDVVDSHFEAGQYRVQRAHFQSQQVVSNILGPEASLDDVLGWAKSNLKPDEISHFNERLGNPETTAEAVELLSYRMFNAGGTAQSGGIVTGGSPSGSPTTAGFANKAEWMAAAKESNQKYGSWEHDQAFLARLYNTDPRIVRSFQ